jgi:hypothetical protein
VLTRIDMFDNKHTQPGPSHFLWMKVYVSKSISVRYVDRTPPHVKGARANHISFLSHSYKENSGTIEQVQAHSGVWVLHIFLLQLKQSVKGAWVSAL